METSSPSAPKGYIAGDSSFTNGKFIILPQNLSQNHPFPLKDFDLVKEKPSLSRSSSHCQHHPQGTSQGGQEGFADPSQLGQFSSFIPIPKLHPSYAGCSPCCILL